MRKDSRLEELFFKGVQLRDVELLSSYKFRSDHEIVEAIDSLSELYVKNRHDLKNVSLSPKLASGYLYFYFSTNIPKLFALLNLLPKDLVEKMRELIFIDVGAGPATYTIAWYSYFFNHFKVLPEISLLIEKDIQMKIIAEKVLDFYLPHEEIRISENYSAINFEKLKKSVVLFFGHSANEMEVEEIFKYIDEIKPKFLIFLEPGTPEVFKHLISLRSLLLLKNYEIHFPCFTQSKCPMQNVKDNWCSQYLHLKFQPEIDKLTQLSGLKRQHSSTCFHVYELMEREKLVISPKTTYRVVQGPLESKGKMSWEVCSQEGKIIELETLTRSYSKGQIEELKRITPGNFLANIQIVKDLSPERFRFLVI